MPPSQAATLATTYNNWQEVGAAVEAGGITATASGRGHVKPTNVTDADAGTADNPYLIDSPEALAWFMQRVNTDAAYRSAHVKLTADIDLTGASYGGTSTEALKWVAIGGESTAFTGVFDGSGHAVDYMRILFTNATKNQGLFGRVDGNGVVKNVTVGSHSSVTSGSDDLGGIVGKLTYGTVENCRNEAA
ncbi:MAG: hypothetical protein ACLSVD_15685, partial [Eggerthellaceae bacterium]